MIPKEYIARMFVVIRRYLLEIISPIDDRTHRFYGKSNDFVWATTIEFWDSASKTSTTLPHG